MKNLKKLFKKYKQPIRGFLGWLFGIGIQVGTVGADAMMLWDAKRWAIGLGLAALPGIVGTMRGGDPNHTDEELFDKVQAVKVAKKAALGVETTGEIPILPKG
jgi:hypothetical protein